MSAYVGMGSFFNNLANLGKAERGGATGQPVQYERYVAYYHNECKGTYVTEKMLFFSNNENWSDSSFPLLQEQWHVQ